MDAELKKQIEQLEGENCSLKAEIERLQDLQSPEHERLWEASKAAVQGMLAHPRRYRPRTGASENWHAAISEEAHELARALIAEVDGSLAPAPQHEAPEGIYLWKPDAKGDADFDFARLGQKGAEDVAMALLMSSAARSAHEIDGDGFKVTVVANLTRGLETDP